MTAAEEARVLYSSIIEAEKSFHNTAKGVDFKEFEVRERYNAVRWLLIIARNEAWQMLKEWRDEFIPSKVK